MLNEMIMNVGNKKNVRFRKIDYPGVTPNKYFISEYGDVYNTSTEQFHTMINHKDGYFEVSVGKRFRVLVHRLVAYAFVEKDRDLNLTVDHVDCNKKNNHYTNLEWVTLEENIRRAFRNGLHNREWKEGNFSNDNPDNREKRYQNNYPDELIHTICEMYEQYNYSPIEIYRIIRNDDTTPRGNKESEAFYRMLVSLRKKEVRNDITDMYDYDPKEELNISKSIQTNSIFSKEAIKIIATLYTNGDSITDIAKNIHSRFK